MRDWCIATCVGLFLFTRILIPDVVLTLTITLALWAFLRALDEDRGASARLGHGHVGRASAAGLLLKGLIGRRLSRRRRVFCTWLHAAASDGRTWRRLRILPGLADRCSPIAAPWHVLATLRNPPYFDFTMHSERGSYRGFFWFYFINEHVLRFLNLRYPRDYNTVPRLCFWLFHLLWLFPWSVYLPARRRSCSSARRTAPSRTRLLALCWAGFMLVFFTFSTTQEYYSMPCYPALALLLGSAMAAAVRRICCALRRASRLPSRRWRSWRSRPSWSTFGTARPRRHFRTR